MAQDDLMKSQSGSSGTLMETERMKSLCFHPGCQACWLQTYLILLHFGLLFYTDIMVFCKLKTRLPTSKRIVTLFIAALALLWWSGTTPATSLRYAYIDLLTLMPACG